MMRNILKKRIMPVLALLVFLTASVYADEGAVSLIPGVTEEMCTPGYWTGADSAKVLMQPQDIDRLNRLTTDTSGTHVFDLTAIREVTDANAQRIALSKITPPDRDLYVKGKKIDNGTYFNRISKAILNTGYTDKTFRNLYAICTDVAAIRAIPTNDIIGYNPTDPDDEYQSTSLLVGEPFVIRQKCVINGETFYWGYSDNLEGWVCADKLGICASREEWLKAWKVDTAGKDFLVVWQDYLRLEPSITVPETSEKELTMGTVLRLVEPENRPEQLAERNAWNNYMVYVPVRTEDGAFKAEPALISQHADVSVGYLPFTEENVYKVVFGCLGNRYGWGNMLRSMDCSGYIRNVYRCFGLTLPRNTTWQQLLSGTVIDFTGMTDGERMACLRTLPAGTPLYFPGHAFILLGVAGDTAYAISATGMLDDGVGELKIQNTYSVIVTPLTVRRGSGNTWLHEIKTAVVLTPGRNLANCTLQAGGGRQNPIVQVSDGDVILQEGMDYICSFTENAVCVIGRGSYLGAKRASLPAFSDVPGWAEAYPAVQWALEKGLITGLGADTFGPDALCTRGQAAAILYRAAGSPEYSGTSSFADVPADAYYAAATAWAAENGLVTGMEAGAFGPDAPCTRSQVVTVFYRVAGSPAISGAPSFADVPADAYYAEAVQWAAEKGIVEGVSQTTFAPDEPCTRSQLVTMLYRWRNLK